MFFNYALPNAKIPSARSENSHPSGYHASPLVTNTTPDYPLTQTCSDTPLTRLTSIVNSRFRSRDKKRTLKTSKHVFYQVLEMYQQEVFKSIAEVIGLTPEALLRMALSLGILEIQNMASNTEKPFCGYSPADAIPTLCRQEPPEKDHWSMREMICLSALYTEYRHLPLVEKRIENVCNRHMCKRGFSVIEGRVRKMHGTPWVARADYGRLAHEFQERRGEAGRAVALRLEIGEEHGHLVEEALFDKEELRLHGYTVHTKSSTWEPRHISYQRDIDALRKLVQSCQENPSYRQEDWSKIVKRLCDDGLYTVLKRFSVSPIPDYTLLHQDFETTEHAEVRRRFMTCIMEAFES